jgi:hypothetical protein
MKTQLFILLGLTIAIAGCQKESDLVVPAEPGPAIETRYKINFHKDAVAIPKVDVISIPKPSGDCLKAQTEHNLTGSGKVLLPDVTSTSNNESEYVVEAYGSAYSKVWGTGRSILQFQCGLDTRTVAGTFETRFDGIVLKQEFEANAYPVPGDGGFFVRIPLNDAQVNTIGNELELRDGMIVISFPFMKEGSIRVIVLTNGTYCKAS